ncbi:hypothetical protein [Massilia pseudoviolaceinigra]|uniref:hypothetical protein n=1 Tax=Massilia pseudoviolaceinigra TaxID=3057165 RepID=UPI002796DA02|nr:hypothetical protein [Massilia sp. CCM 9206]MDQ1923576.1 hypothetical protein [Massilia sp. CCM 9206]
MIPILRSFRVHPLCLLISGVLLSACHGSSDSTPAPVTPPPPEPPVKLLGESMVGKQFMPGGIAVDAAGTIYVGNGLPAQLPPSGPAEATIEVVKVSQTGTVSPFINQTSIYTGAGPAVAPGQVVQLVFNSTTQTLYALDMGMDSSYSLGVIRPISAAGVVGTLRLADTPTHANYSPVPTTIAQRPVALAIGPDGALHAYGAGYHAPSSTPTVGSYSVSFNGWQTVNPDGSGRLVYSQESGHSSPGRHDPRGPFTYTYPADLGATAGRLGRNDGGLAVDSAGNGYIADTARHAIIKVTPTGSASIFAGAVTEAGSADGTGTAARFNQPTQLVVDKVANVFVLDRGNATVRKITPAGVVTTVLGVAGQAQTKTGELPGGLGAPMGLAMDADGRLYVTVDKGVVRAKLP